MEWTHKFYTYKISTLMVRLLNRYKITPNQITIFNFFFTIIGGIYFFSRGTWIGNIFGVIVCLINVLLDYVDGDYARQTNNTSPVNAWLDVCGDIIIRNCIMAGIAFGIYKNSFTLWVILLYFISSNASHIISFYYNNTFGFDSYKGNTLFRKWMNVKPTIFNRFMKNVIDPTSSFAGLVIYTVRYWIILGAIFNFMRPVFIYLTVVITFQWMLMFVLYALHLSKYKKLYVLQALAILDENREEYHAIRSGKKI